MPLTHHELCFGCGRTNLFGLLLELEPQEDGSVAGRCFIKQDHQGAERGFAHEGIIAAALSEAMTLAAGPDKSVRRLQIELSGQVPVGAFLEVQGWADCARAIVDGAEVATATAQLADR